MYLQVGCEAVFTDIKVCKSPYYTAQSSISLEE